MLVNDFAEHNKGVALNLQVEELQAFVGMNIGMGLLQTTQCLSVDEMIIGTHYRISFSICHRNLHMYNIQYKDFHQF